MFSVVESSFFGPLIVVIVIIMVLIVIIVIVVAFFTLFLAFAFFEDSRSCTEGLVGLWLVAPSLRWQVLSVDG